MKPGMTGFESTRHGRACPGHPRLFCGEVGKAWMPGTGPGMTGQRKNPGGKPPGLFILRSNSDYQ